LYFNDYFTILDNKTINKWSDYVAQNATKKMLPYKFTLPVKTYTVYLRDFICDLWIVQFCLSGGRGRGIASIFSPPVAWYRRNNLNFVRGLTSICFMNSRYSERYGRPYSGLTSQNMYRGFSTTCEQQNMFRIVFNVLLSQSSVTRPP